MNHQYKFHVPVLLNECLEGLAIRSNYTFLDLTLGNGSHFYKIIERLYDNCIAIGIDRDIESVQCVKANIKKSKCRVILEHCRFSEFDLILKKYSISSLDGVLLDLGLSSHQIDSLHRGFSYKVNTRLDMRMNQNDSTTAEELIRGSSLDELAMILGSYGEINNPERMAAAIQRYLETHTIETSGDLVQCLEMEYGKPVKYKVLSKVFQAIRIAVNNELEELRNCLPKVIRYLRKKGRLVVIAYHSLEDRIVKKFIYEKERKCVCPSHIPECCCNIRPVLRRITRKVKRPSALEIAKNNRARSARLRIAEKL
jgi:16S rRNA (cytosine1402-N4)-methyltransferase